MKRHGQTVDRTRKYTDEEIRRACHKYLEPSLIQATRKVQELHIMAFKDYMLAHGPKNLDIDRAIIDYCALVDKYALDLENKEFTEAQMKKYNREGEKS